MSDPVSDKLIILLSTICFVDGSSRRLLLLSTEIVDSRVAMVKNTRSCHITGTPSHCCCCLTLFVVVAICVSSTPSRKFHHLGVSWIWVDLSWQPLQPWPPWN